MVPVWSRAYHQRYRFPPESRPSIPPLWPRRRRLLPPPGGGAPPFLGACRLARVRRVRLHLGWLAEVV